MLSDLVQTEVRLKIRVRYCQFTFFYSYITFRQILNIPYGFNHISLAKLNWIFQGGRSVSKVLK
jgi:hypothetical protein